MVEDMSRAQTVEQPKAFTRDDLRRVLARISDNVATAVPGQHPKDRLEERQILIRETIEKLISQKERFKSVFTTGNGSHYFILESGENFRIKFNKEIGAYELQPLLRQIFFIEVSEWERLAKLIENGRKYPPDSELATNPSFQARKRIYERMKGGQIDDTSFKKKEESRKGAQKFLGEPISITALKPGVLPIEFDFADGTEETLIKVDNGHIIILGSRIKMANGMRQISTKLLGAFHHGSVVREVIKG